MMDRSEALAQIRHRNSEKRTICEVFREIHDVTDKLTGLERDVLRELIIDGYIMGKKMDAKLKEYKSDWDAKYFWQPKESARRS